MISVAQRIWRSALAFAILGTGLRVGGNLLLIPLVLHYLSTREQALWWVFLALGGFANLADFGFGQVISRVYSYLWAGCDDFDAEGLRPPPRDSEPNLARIRQLNVTVRFLYARLSAAAMLLLAVGGSVLLIRSIRASADPWRIWSLWGAYLAVVGYALFSSHWQFAAQGVNRMRDMQLANIWSSLAYVASAVLLLTCGAGLLAMVVAVGFRAVLGVAFVRRAYHRSVPKLPNDPAQPDLTIVRRLWPNARKFGILSIGGYLLSNATVLISNSLLSVQTTASVGLTNQIGNFTLSFANLWLAVKWPQITILRTRGELTAMSRLFARRLALALITFAFLAVGVFLLGNTILGWMGTNTQLLPAPYLIVYFVYLAHQLVYTNFGMLAFTENVVPFFKVGLSTGVAMLVLSLILTRICGLWGLILAPFLAEAAYSGWFTIRRGFQGQPLSARQLLREALQPGV